MAYSFTLFNFVLIIAFILTIVSIILLFIAPNYLITSNDNLTALNIVSNNATASSMLYAAGVISIIILVLMLILVFIYYYMPIIVENNINEVLIEAAKFSISFYVILIIIIIMIMLLFILIIIAISYINSSTQNKGGSEARTFAIIAIVINIFTLICLGYIFYATYIYDKYLTLLLSPVIIQG